ncbi:MAG: hypothetical protein ACXVC7_09990 [Bacteroidia bacterium]
MYLLKKIIVRFLTCYSLDLRALSLMRIGVAIVILADLCIRASDLTAHYTNEGLWPTQVIHNFGWKTGFWSLHELSGSYSWELTLFIIHFVFAVFLLFGFKTKISNLIVWLLYISLHNRNLFVQQAGDDLLRIVLFWGLFLPWNAYYSYDSKYFKFEPKQRYLANIGYLLLIASVYFFTVNLKYSSEWRGDGTAVYYALSLDQLRLPGLGDWLYGHSSLMKFCTYFIYYVEVIIPVLILWPAKKGYLRWFAFILIIIIHTGIGFTLYVGLFFIINMITAIGLVPGFVFDKLEERFSFLKFTTRSAIAKKNSFLLSVKKKLDPIIGVVCITVIAISLIINLSSLKWFSYGLRNESLIPVNILRLDQFWGMFSPAVLKRDGWFVYHGMDSLGRQWDLRLNQDYVDYKKPGHVVSMYKSDRWRKLAENMQRDDMTFLRPLYCRYVIKKWNKEHPEKKIAMLNLYYLQKENLPDYKTSEVTKVLFSVCDGH